VVVLKIRSTEYGFKSRRPVTYYIPSWRIISVEARPKYVKITYEAVNGYEEGGSYSEYVMVELPFDGEKSDEEAMPLAEYLAERIVEMMDDRSVKIVDMEDLIREVKIVS